MSIGYWHYPQGLGFPVSARMHAYVCDEVSPWVSTGYEPKDKNIVLPQGKGPEVKFNMLPFIVFNYKPVSGHGNNLEPRKRYIAPRAQTQKKIRKNYDFGL